MRKRKRLIGMGTLPTRASAIIIFSHLCLLSAEMTHTISETNVRPSVHNQTQCTHKPIDGTGRGRETILNDMIFKVIRGQGQGHGPVKVAKIADFEVYLLRHLLRYPEYC